VFSVTMPKPVGVTAPDLAIRLREPGLDEREVGRLGRGAREVSVREPDGRLLWNGLASSSRAERCSIFEDGAVSMLDIFRY
jgi:hypothetical protein